MTTSGTDGTLALERSSAKRESVARRRSRWFVAIGLITVFVMALVKLDAARSIKASPLFSDDYAYLNKSIYFLRGDFAMKDYPFQNVFTGIIYPLLLSPWQFFGDPEARIFVVHAINILLSCVTIFFSVLTVNRLLDHTGNDGPRVSSFTRLLAPLCLATFAPVYLFSFYALTENLLFALLAIAAWLATDFERTLRGRLRFLLLLVVVALLPTTRQPGLAVVPAFLLLAAINGKALGWRRAVLGMAAILAAGLVPYWLSMSLAQVGGAAGADFSTKREARYLLAAWRILEDFDGVLALAGLTLAQLSYLIAATACWTAPLFFVALLQIRRMPDASQRRRWLNYAAFALTCGSLLLGFCLLHVVQKIGFDPQKASFIFGRYVDPVALLLLIGGIAAALCVRSLTHFQAGIVRLVAPLAALVTMAWLWEQSGWATINRSGLAILTGGGEYPLLYLAGAVTLLTLALQIRPESRMFAPMLFGFMVVFNVLSVDRGMNSYVRPRAERIAKSQEAAKWLYENSPTTSVVGCDRAVFRLPSPTWRQMGFHFQALVFSAHPRSILLVGTDETLQQCDYLFTSRNRPNPVNLPLAWTNGDYQLYKIVPDAKVYLDARPPPLATPAAPNLIEADLKERPSDERHVADLDYRHLVADCCPKYLDFSEFRLSRKEVRHGHRLVLAWQDSSVTSPSMLLPAGQFRFTIRVEGEGCLDDPPILQAGVNNRAKQEFPLQPYRARCVHVDFVLDEEEIVELKLTFINDGFCVQDGIDIDKNVWVDSIILEPRES